MTLHRRPAPALALLAAAASFAPACASASALSFFGCSDVHFGHDVVAKDNTTTTALALNRAAVAEMNALGTPNNDTWPDALGGGPVLPPVGLVITGDLIDNGWVPTVRGADRPAAAIAHTNAFLTTLRSLSLRFISALRVADTQRQMKWITSRRRTASRVTTAFATFLFT